MLRASLAVIAFALAASSVTGSGTISFGSSVEHVTVHTSGSSGRATFNDRTASGNVNGSIDVNCVRIPTGSHLRDSRRSFRFVTTAAGKRGPI